MDPHEDNKDGEEDPSQCDVPPRVRRAHAAPMGGSSCVRKPAPRPRPFETCCGLLLPSATRAAPTPTPRWGKEGRRRKLQQCPPSPFPPSPRLRVCPMTSLTERARACFAGASRGIACVRGEGEAGQGRIRASVQRQAGEHRSTGALLGPRARRRAPGLASGCDNRSRSRTTPRARPLLKLAARCRVADPRGAASLRPTPCPHARF